MTGKYILRDKTVVPEPDLLTWGRWLETADRQVANTLVGDVRVSTVFLGLDHSFGDDRPPILFETMVFGGSLEDEMDRYATWDEAEKGHAAMVEKVKAAQ